jgi:hypothetical protein
MEVPEVPVHGFLRYCGHRLQQGQGDLFANDCRGLEQVLGGSW